MKVLWLLVLGIVLSVPCFAGYVNGYVNSYGTYVNGYYRSDANSTVTDNYSYSGNYNPYSGSLGTDRYTHSKSSYYYDYSDY